MFRIVFYKDEKGREPVKDYLVRLAEKGDKDSIIKKNKFRDYIRILSEKGTYAGKPYIKHLVDNHWELRPMNDRIVFACVKNGVFVLLHVFHKTTNKTPRKEIMKAKQEYYSYIRRDANE